jgi:hypothetical protein
MKTSFKGLLSLLSLLALPVVVQAQFTFTTNNGALTITRYTGCGDAVTLPSTTNGLPVTSIGDYAFILCNSLTTVTIPNSFTNIGNSAFYWCSSLASVTIGTNVTSVGNFAFYGCTSLTTVAIPNSVTNIGSYAFDGCSSLTTVTIGNSLNGIGSFAFISCSSLTTISVDALNSVYSSADGVLFDKSQAALKQYPTGRAGAYAISNSVTSIESSAFYACTSLTSVKIPSSLTNIGGFGFYACGSLTTISVEALNPVYSSVDGVLFDKSQATLVQFPAGRAGTYTISNSVTSIESSAFSTCTRLSSVVSPASVTNIGSYAFNDCTNLTEVYFGGNAPSVGASVFYSDINATIYYLPGTTNWFSTLDGRPTALWKPQIAKDASFGVQTNRFGFNVNWASGMVVVVEACPNLANPIWSPLQTNTFTGDSFYFSDPQWTNYPVRLYRLRSL